MKKILSITIMFLVVLPAISVFTPQAKAESSSLVGYWKFDDGSGTAATDSSGNGNTGTLMNGPQWVDGISGKALKFDGTDDYLSASDSPSLDVSGNQITVMFWMKSASDIDASTPYQKLYDKGDAYHSAIGGGGMIFTIAYVHDIHSVRKTWSGDTWYHIAHVYNGSTISIYVDGVLDNSEPETGSIHVTSLPFTIAAYTYGGKWYFPGTIDEFRIFSHALSPSEILDDYMGSADSENSIFQDDFESYAVDSFPSAGGWELVYNGMGTQYQIVTDTASHSPTKSLQLWGQSGWSANVQRKFTSNSEILGYEAYVRADSNIGTGHNIASMSFWDLEGLTWGKRFANTWFGQDGEIYTRAVSESPFIPLGLTYEADRWYKVRVIVDRSLETYDIWIDDALAAQDVVIWDTDEIDAFMLQSGHAGIKAYFDDVKVFEGVQVSLPWRDDFDYQTKQEMKDAGWILDGEERISVGGGIVGLDNDGSQGSSVRYLGNFPSGINDFSVEAKSKWIGRAYGQRVFYVWTQRHRYGWYGDGYYPEYSFIRYSDGWSGEDVKVLRFGGYAPVINEWATFTLEKRGNTFYMYEDGILKNTYAETDSAPDELVGVSISAGWISTVEYDYMSVEETTAAEPDFEISVSPIMISAVPRHSNTFSVKVTSINGFNNPVMVEVFTDSNEIVATPSQFSVVPDPNGCVETTIDVSVLSTYIGLHIITIKGSSGNLKAQGTVTLKVPYMSVSYFTQGDVNWCYPTCVAMIMNFYGIFVHPWDAAVGLFLDHEASVSGWTQTLLYQYLLQNGLNYDLEGLIISKQSLVNMLKKNYPVLLFLLSLHHVVVITGYSEDSDVFFIHDPSGALIEKLFPTETGPFMGVAVPWSKLEPYAAQTLNYAVGVNEGLMGEATACLGTLDIIGGDSIRTITFSHGSPLNPTSLYIWSSGYVLPMSPYTLGLTWRNDNVHPLRLDPEDYIMISYPPIVNPTDTARKYRVEIFFTSQAFETSWKEDLHEVDACSKGFAFGLTRSMREALGNNYGAYEISLALWCDGELIDLVDLPKVKYVPQMKISLHSPATLFITDSQGRSIGVNPDTGDVVNQIPNATYSGPDADPQVGMIPNPINDTYSIILVGTTTGNYTLTIEYVTAEQTTTQTFNGTISEQEKQYYSASLTETGEMTTISWEYVFEDTKRGTMLKISTDDQYFQFVASDKTFSVKYDPDMFVYKHTIIICYNDTEIKLFATAVDSKIDFCVAYAKDMQTGKTYWLIDKPSRGGSSRYILRK